MTRSTLLKPYPADVNKIFFIKNNIFLLISYEINNLPDSEKWNVYPISARKTKKLARCKKNIIHKYIHTINKGIVKITTTKNIK